MWSEEYWSTEASSQTCSYHKGGNRTVRGDRGDRQLIEISKSVLLERKGDGGVGVRGGH